LPRYSFQLEGFDPRSRPSRAAFHLVRAAQRASAPSWSIFQYVGQLAEQKLLLYKGRGAVDSNSRQFVSYIIMIISEQRADRVADPRIIAYMRGCWRLNTKMLGHLCPSFKAPDIPNSFWTNSISCSDWNSLASDFWFD
jgi:hypothetical protein